MVLPTFSDLAALVRLPAVLSVPGDVLVGAAAGGLGSPRRTAVVVGSSACLYLAGMALNDWADRDVDARERPGRPIPSGRVTPEFAFAVAAGLTVTGLGLAAASGAGLGVALPLAGMVWAYDLVLKQTGLGPAAMAACRSLDVLGGAVGSPGSLRAALPVAAVVGAHTSVVTGLSRREVSGGGGAVAYAALAGTAGVVAAATRLGGRGRRGCRRCSRLASAALAGAYTASFGGAQWRAVREPTPAHVQQAVGAGVLGLMPLEASLLAGSGASAQGALVAAAWPAARRLARRRSVT